MKHMKKLWNSIFVKRAILGRYMLGVYQDISNFKQVKFINFFSAVKGKEFKWVKKNFIYEIIATEV